MKRTFKQIITGYNLFREKYVLGDSSVMELLSQQGQKPHIMIVACCDSRVDPALILQCDPGDLFVVRNVANIIPPYEKDHGHHGVSAALEFGISFLKIKHLVILGHSQCGGIEALIAKESFPKNDFISDWVSLITASDTIHQDTNKYAKWALTQSKQNSMTFPWIHDKVIRNQLAIHLWFFDIQEGQLYTHSETTNDYQPLNPDLE